MKISINKINSWTRRYLPAEIVGTITAVLLGTITHSIAENAVITAFIATWGENLGFYTVIIGRDVLSTMCTHHSKQSKYGFMIFIKDIRNIFLEFGPSEILDSLIIRPFMMIVFPKILNNISAGIFVGKLVADGVFYAITIASYEITRKNSK